MNKKPHLYVITAVVCIVAIISLALQFSSKMPVFAYVDNSRLFNEATVIIEANEIINETQKKEQEKLSKIEREMERLQTLIEYNSADEQIQQAYSSVYQTYQKQLGDSQAVLSNAEQEHLSPAINEVNKGIKQYAINERLDFVLGATSDGNIVYAEKVFDITDEVIEFINKSN